MDTSAAHVPRDTGEMELRVMISMSAVLSCPHVANCVSILQDPICVAVTKATNSTVMASAAKTSMSVRYPMTVCSSAQIIQVAEAVPVLKDTKLIQLITLPVYQFYDVMYQKRAASKFVAKTMGILNAPASKDTS